MTDNDASDKRNDETYFVYVLVGSQYCAKVLAALDWARIPHRVVAVSLDPKRRSEELPSGGRKVPEMKVVRGGGGGSGSGCEEEETVAIVQDSEGILRWFDENWGTAFFPEPKAARARMLSSRAGDGALAGSVLYYNWVNPEGYARSVRKSIKDQALPNWLPLKGAVTDLAVKGERAKFRQEAAKMLRLREDQLSDESFVRQLLVMELRFFQSHLLAPDQTYLLGPEPTAADFSAYAQLERLVGDTGDANLFCSLPELLQDKELDRLWTWYRHMRQHHPIVFRGKEGTPPTSTAASPAGKAKRNAARSPRTPLAKATKGTSLPDATSLPAPPVTP
jgi:glutathione S-transferase